MEQQQQTISQRVLVALPDAIALVSDHGKYRFSCRQLYYVTRSRVLSSAGVTLPYQTFVDLVGKYEKNREDGIPGLITEVRGVYCDWTTNEEISFQSLCAPDRVDRSGGAERILIVERKVLFQVLQQAGWPEQHGCSLICTLGYPTRHLGKALGCIAGPRLTLYVVHDADACGNLMLRALREVVDAIEDVEVTVVDLGLFAEEALQMGLPVQHVARRQPLVEDLGVPDEWREWFSTYRVELDAMSVPQLIEWLDKKLSEHEGEAEDREGE